MSKLPIASVICEKEREKEIVKKEQELVKREQELALDSQKYQIKYSTMKEELDEKLRQDEKLYLTKKKELDEKFEKDEKLHKEHELLLDKELSQVTQAIDSKRKELSQVTQKTRDEIELRKSLENTTPIFHGVNSQRNLIEDEYPIFKKGFFDSNFITMVNDIFTRFKRLLYGVTLTEHNNSCSFFFKGYKFNAIYKYLRPYNPTHRVLIVKMPFNRRLLKEDISKKELEISKSKPVIHLEFNEDDWLNIIIKEFKILGVYYNISNHAHESLIVCKEKFN